jgi:hypothetical protein
MNPRELARRVLEVRLWQHLINEEMKRAAFIPIHAAFGHEALAVTLDEARSAGLLALTHRNMAYQFACARAAPHLPGVLIGLRGLRRPVKLRC